MKNTSNKTNLNNCNSNFKYAEKCNQTKTFK